jgi:hypothetical protein
MDVECGNYYHADTDSVQSLFPLMWEYVGIITRLLSTRLVNGDCRLAAIKLVRTKKHAGSESWPR